MIVPTDSHPLQKPINLLNFKHAQKVILVVSLSPIKVLSNSQKKINYLVLQIFSF